MRPDKDQLEQRLRREKPEHSAPAGFTGRVMSSLPDRADETLSPVHSNSQHRQLLWPRLAIAFALLAIAAVLLPELVSDKTTQSTPGQANATSIEHEQTAGLPLPDPLPLPSISAEQFQLLTTRLDEPLEKELNNVISDTRLAIQFVAANFIPEKY